MKGLRLCLLALASAVPVLFPTGVSACAACFGKSDSSMAHGMNVGILSLLAVIVTVLSMLAGFFIFLAKRSARVTAPAPDEVGETTTRA